MKKWLICLFCLVAGLLVGIFSCWMNAPLAFIWRARSLLIPLMQFFPVLALCGKLLEITIHACWIARERYEAHKLFAELETIDEKSLNDSKRKQFVERYKIAFSFAPWPISKFLKKYFLENSYDYGYMVFLCQL